MSFSADGQRLVSVSQERTLQVWEVRGGREILTTGPRQASRAAFSPDGTIACVGADAASAGMCDASTGERRVLFSGHTSNVRAIAVSADGARAVTASEDRTARVWDTKTGRELLCIKAQAPVFSAALAQNSKLLATGGWDGAIRLWDATRDVSTVVLSPGIPAGFTEGHSRLITAAGGGPIREWETDGVHYARWAKSRHGDRPCLFLTAGS